MRFSPPKFYTFFSFLVVLTLIGLTFTLITYFGAINEGRAVSFTGIAVPMFAGFYLWGLFFPVIFYITKHFGFGEKQTLWRNLLFHFLLGIIFSIAHFALQTTIAWLINPVLQGRFPDLLAYLRSSFLGSLYLGLPFYTLLVFAAQTFITQQRAAAEEKKSAQLKSELAQAQLKALKMQLQPHFLFNTLNSISALVLTNPAAAYEMIAKLGDFLRLTLDYNEDQLVPLREELRFLRAYVEIEQIRFSDRLQVNFEIADDVLNAIMPHLALQPLVENSIKHAISQRSADGIIEIKANKIDDNLRISIRDNGSGRNNELPQTKNISENGTGLLNVNSRLAHYYGKSFDLKINKNADNIGMTVSLLLPLEFELKN